MLTLFYRFKHTLTTVLLLALSWNVQGQEAGVIEKHYPPLFPLQLQAAFPKPAQTFQQLLGLVRDHYYSDAINEQELYYAAIEGILRYVSPPQLKERNNLWSAQEYQRIFEALTGLQSSVGIKSNFNPVEGALTVREVLPGSPAQSLLQQYDRIMRINGESLKGKSVQEIDRLLRGVPGDSVRFKVVRDIYLLDVQIQLEEFKASALSTAQLPDGITYIALRKMSKDSAAGLANIIHSFNKKPSQGVILDLRGNGGGIFTEALKIAELFLPARKQVVHTLKRGGNIKTYISGNKQPAAMKLVVLVNHKTASAAEILTAALQANNRAQVVGTTTFGKATLEQTFGLNNGYRARFIIGALYGPTGRSWYGAGIRPDLMVNVSDSSNPAPGPQTMPKSLSQDSQLLAAWRLLH